LSPLGGANGSGNSNLGFGGNCHATAAADQSVDLEVKSVMTSRCFGQMEQQQAANGGGNAGLFADGPSGMGAPHASNNHSESPCPVIVRQQIQDVLDDDDDDIINTPTGHGVGGGSGKLQMGSGGLTGMMARLPATPSADSGFGGGNPSPPPSNASTTSPSSTSGGDSPAPSVTSVTQLSQISGSGHHGHHGGLLPLTTAGSARQQQPDTVSFFPQQHPQQSSFNMGGPNSLIQPSEHIDMSTLQQAIALVQMGVDSSALDNVLPSSSGNGSGMINRNPANNMPPPPGPAGDCAPQVGPKQAQSFNNQGVVPSSSNFANNLRALANLEQQQNLHPTSYQHFRTPSPEMQPPHAAMQQHHSRQYGHHQNSHQQLPVFQSQRSMYDSLEFRNPQQQRPMHHQQPQQQLQRFYSEDFSGGYNAAYGAGPLQQQHPHTGGPRGNEFYRGKNSFRGSNNSLASSDGGGSTAGILGNLGRLELNKGGLGKNPYAGLLALNGGGLQVPGMRAMQVRCKFGQLGQGEGQFNSPHGFCLGRNEEIVVADTHNHRIQIFDKDGIFKYMFGNQGKAEGCLWYPRKVAVIRHSGNFVVCDRGGERSRMQIFNSYGHFSHAISIRFIDIVAGLAINHEGHIVAVDSVTPTIFVLSEMGELLRFHECSDFMKEPSDIGIFDRNYYVCDFKDHSVVVVSEEGKLLRKIGSDQVTCFPNGIDISDAGDVLIGDSHGNKFHVAVYDNKANCASQFECPHVKVSRCCGLKITSEGYIVTLAKNNHHVLVLDTIYIDKN